MATVVSASRLSVIYPIELCCGAAYMSCFDGSVKHGEGGGGSCMFRIRTDGCKNERLLFLDRKVFLHSSSATRAEYAGMLAGVTTFAEALGDFPELHGTAVGRYSGGLDFK